MTYFMNIIALSGSTDSLQAVMAADGSFNIGHLIKLVLERITGWGETGVKYLPNFIVAALILTLFYFISRWVRKLVTKLMHNVTDNVTIIDLVETMSGLIVMAMGLFIALTVLNLGSTVTSMLAGLGVVGLALGFAFRDIAANFISGVFLSIQHPFGKGDIIECKDHYGTVQKINLRCTIIETMQGQIVYIPNKDVYSGMVINYTDNHERRVDLPIGVSYGDDHRKARELAVEAVKDLDSVDNNKPIDLYYTGIGGSTFDYKIRFWVNFHKQTDFLSARSEAIIAIGETYEQNDIDMSYPIRTLDFAPKGGVPINEVWKGGNSGE